ncbi:MAG TPA: DUF3488 and transglutaminase-like domain-containing protein, partial [Tepidisphaeraceae bacterium]
QLVKLYELRGNRDLAQMLVLSLLLMVAAAISTGTLLFGVLFVTYLFVSLYCCLLFHLKAETDHAKAVMGVDAQEPDPVTFKQDQRFLSRSMRRLTALVSVLSVMMAIVVFLLFPRGTGAGIIPNMAFKPSQAMTGFSDQVNFQDVARITQNEAEVAYVTIKKNDQPWGGPGETIYLRGSAPDTYVSDPASAERWKWIREPRTKGTVVPQIGRNDPHVFNEEPAGEDRYDQTIRLLPTGSSTLFAMPGVVRFTPTRDVRLSFGTADDVMQLQEPLTGEFQYNVISSGVIGTRDAPRVLLRNDAGIDNNSAPLSFPIPPRVREFAMKDEVAGTDDNGNLAAQRLQQKKISALDERIARNFERYLQNNFTYTLDLTDARRVADEDPLTQFLYDFKRGHCEYFAGAMALMCQSLGMEARVIVGFKSNEFNAVGGYYIIKQSTAHAWVEVRMPEGWQMFDPTAAGGPTSVAQGQGAWRQFKHFMNYLEYAWGSNVVNYDTETRTSLIQNVDSGLTNAGINTFTWMQDLSEWFDLQNFYFVSSKLLSGLVGLMVLGVVVALLYFLLERIRLRRLARRIGLDQLASVDRRRLAKQLSFYDELLRTLDRRAVPRPVHLTPLEFSRSVGFLPGELYATIGRLTQIFYRVRYGGYELDPGQQRRLERVVQQIDTTLAAK